MNVYVSPLAKFLINYCIQFFLAATGQPQAAPPPSQIEDQQQAPQQNHANYQQNDQVSQQNYQDWNQYNQQHQGYSDQGAYSYWDGNNYVNYVSHYSPHLLTFI